MNDGTEDRAEGAERVPGKVWRATLWLVLGRGVSGTAALVALALLARRLDATEFGLLTFYFALFAFLESFVDAGTSTAVVQRGALDARSLAGAIRSGRRIRLVAASVACVLVVASARIANESDFLWIALTALVPLTRSLELSSTVFHANMNWGVPVIVRSGGALLRLLCVVVLWSAGVTSFGPYLFAHVACGGLGNVVLWLASRARVGAHHGPLVPLLRTALPLAVASVAQYAYFYADNLVIRDRVGEAELGLYNGAVRILSLLIMVAGFASNVSLPWLTRRSDAGDLARAVRTLSIPMVAFGIAIAAALFPFAGDLLRLLFGERFLGATSSLRWLLVAAVIVCAGSGLLTAVIASGRTAAFLVIVVAGLVLNVIGNLLLVPDLGIEGAAVATVATEFFVAVASFGVLAGVRSRA